MPLFQHMWQLTGLKIVLGHISASKSCHLLLMLKSNASQILALTLRLNLTLSIRSFPLFCTITSSLKLYIPHPLVSILLLTYRFSSAKALMVPEWQTSHGGPSSYHLLALGCARYCKAWHGKDRFLHHYWPPCFQFSTLQGPPSFHLTTYCTLTFTSTKLPSHWHHSWFNNL